MRIALTHSEGSLRGLADLLEQAGHEVLSVPLVRTEPLPAAEVAAGLPALRECPWLLLTSANATRAFHALGGSLQPERGLGVVGPGTGTEVRELGGRVDLTAAEGTGEALAAAFLRLRDPGPVALPLGDRAAPTVRRLLEWGGVEVRSLVVYRTLTLPWPPGAGNVDAVLVASPSALDAVPREVARAARLVAIGPITAAAARARGLQPVQSEAPEPQAVARALQEIAGQAGGGVTT
ncbi:MAG TPA: uroporphyrinogen-III synthase [Deinococcales bacterium]|nr:uroporphyrinogen-III synthase [Deinococcales bacterium]